MNVSSIIEDPSVINELADDGLLNETLNRVALRARDEDTRQLYAVAHDARVEPANRTVIKDFFGWL